MPDRRDFRPGQPIVEHTLAQCYRANLRAITDDEGLDGADGQHVLCLIEDSLGYDPSF